jgi:filamentous hemagglutinin
MEKRSGLTTEQAVRLGESLAALLPVYGTPIGLYQAISGKSLSGEDLTTAERFFNGAAAAVPLGSAAYKLFNSAVAEMRVASSVGGIGADGKALMDFSQLSSQQKGLVGELLGANTVANVLPGATRLGRTGDMGSRGIDDLYKVTSANADYVIVEYKFGTSTLGKTADGLQMSDGWVQGSDRILNAVGGNTFEALKISDAIAAGRVEKWVVHTDPAGGTSVWIADSTGRIVRADSALASAIIGVKGR